jgi:hypothetical protein
MVKDTCFVIMPFGIKPFSDSPEKTFDFDKIYRTIIRRAIQEAGMEAIRADEKSGSHIIHSDMFKELRDRAVVLADLSLSNPNVYYELGIRHVLSPAGTVLICKEGTELPFDIRLSKVIFYRYNGVDIDWEVVEKTIPLLSEALKTAQERRPDSPVHALLENVFPCDFRFGENRSQSNSITYLEPKDFTENTDFEKIVASHWRNRHGSIDTLIESSKKSVFGVRALGELCLLIGEENEKTITGNQIFCIAENLYFQQQYDFSYTILMHLKSIHPNYCFTPIQYIRFGSAASERNPTMDGANEGLILMRTGLEMAIIARKNGNEDDTFQLFKIHNSIGGLYLWMWQLLKDKDNNEDEEASKSVLEKSIANLKAAVESLKGSDNAKHKPSDQIAKMYLRLTVLMRILANTPDYPDRENYLPSILKLKESESENELSSSYLRWYKVIVHADLGNEQKVREGIINAVQKDALLTGAEVGHSEYIMLRRFIGNNLPYFRNKTLMGLISQDLQYSCK